jgi:diacylglycerol kinase (ATP)
MTQAGSILIIANPTAGSTSDGLVAELAGVCGQYGTVRTAWTTERGAATRIAATAGADGWQTVVAVGGDGTVHEVVAGLAAAGGPAPALLIVPGGTGNSNYLAQWGDLPWGDAVRAALSRQGAQLCRLDLARLEERDTLVLLGACSGLIAEALIPARQIRERGRRRYQLALARAAETFAPYPGRVLVDGREVHAGPTVLANVGGGRHRGGTYPVLPASQLDDGLLDVCVIGGGIPAPQVPELILQGRHVGHPEVVFARGRTVTVERTDGAALTFEHDGELCAGQQDRSTMRVRGNALPVLCRVGMPGLGSAA